MRANRLHLLLGANAECKNTVTCGHVLQADSILDLGIRRMGPFVHVSALLASMALLYMMRIS
jgi:hypothetical protein